MEAWAFRKEKILFLKSLIKKERPDIKNPVFKDKETGKVADQETILKDYEEHSQEGELFINFIKKNYQVSDKPIDKANDVEYSRHSKKILKNHWYKSKKSGMIAPWTKKQKFLDVAKEFEGIMGKKTSEGFEIKDYSLHSIDRSIGTNKDPVKGKPRKPARVGDILKALQEEEPEETRDGCFRYRNSKVKVIFNEEQGAIVTVIGKD